MISHILVKEWGKTCLTPIPGQPMGWLGWPVATALNFNNQFKNGSLSKIEATVYVFWADLETYCPLTVSLKMRVF